MGTTHTITEADINTASLKELAGIGYALTKQQKQLDDIMKLIKARFKNEAELTGVTEYMGENSKVIISARSSTEIAARSLYKAMKAAKMEALFWGMVKVNVTEAKKTVPGMVEELGVTTVDVYNSVAFK